MTSSPHRPMRILCLHGLTENSFIMESKLAAMRKHLPPNDFEFVFQSAPYVLPAVESAPVAHGALSLNANKVGTAEKSCEKSKSFNKACLATSYVLAAEHYTEADKKRPQSDDVAGVSDLVPKYKQILNTIDEETKQKAEEHVFSDAPSSKRWWTLPSKEGKLSPYIGQETGLAQISKTMREKGPFDGVIGFSTGAMMAAFCQALLQGSIASSTAPTFNPPPDQSPFQFSIFIAPWMMSNGPYKKYFDALHSVPDAHTPTLCFEGIRDRHCVKGSCAEFAACLSAERYEYHNGGHSIPIWDEYPAFMADWLKLAANGCRGDSSKDEAKRARLRLASPYQDVKIRQNHARL